MISGQSQRHMVLEITRFLKYIYTKFVDMVLGVNQNLSMLIIVLLPRHTPSATSSPYSRPEKFYLNCGSDSNINYGGWTFVGDMISGCNLVSLNSKGSEASNQSVPEIYGTTRSILIHLLLHESSSIPLNSTSLSELSLSIKSKMPMFQPFKGGGFDGHVIDLHTAVKDGVLGGGDGGDGKTAAAENELDLKTMITNLELQETPSVFICPISLDPMQDPVTLCTGQTYERSNILKWLSLGHRTCPTTMQELWDDAVTPNKTLHQLIHAWFSQKYVMMKKRSEDVQGRVIEIVGALRKAKGKEKVHALSELKGVVMAHEIAKKSVVEEGGVFVISSLLTPFTSHAVGSEAVAILVNLELDAVSKAGLMQPARVSLMVDMLNDGSIETKINCARLIGRLVEERGFRAELVSSHSLLVGLMRLVKDRRRRNGVSPALALLKSITVHKQVRSLMVSVEAVPQLVDVLPCLGPECLESALYVLDSLCSDNEGVTALKESVNTIPNTVRLLMRVSETCTAYAVSILWSVCRLASRECSSLAVELGLAAKLLLVIQSGCDPALKQRSAELLKLCSLHYSDTMFISKCKLAPTIQ
ncbi:hypothetical protein YC2023_105693 [Brassica napus]